MQSSVTPDDEELMQYTYHGVSRKPSVSDTLLTRSDSVLCMPSMYRRIVTVNKQKSTSAVNKASSFKEPANLTTDISTSVNNNSSSPPVQESNRSTQDASVQVDSSKSSLLNQTADNKSTNIRTCDLKFSALLLHRNCSATSHCGENDCNFCVSAQHWPTSHGELR